MEREMISVPAATTIRASDRTAGSLLCTAPALLRRARRTAGLLALALLAFVSLLPPAPAEAQSIWSATLTVDENAVGSRTFRGCGDFNDSCATGLSDDDFVYSGTTFDVEYLVRETRAAPALNRLSLTLDKAIPSAIRTNGKLTVGTTVLSFSSASFHDSNKEARWNNPGFTWTDNQSVSISLGFVALTPSAITNAGATLTRAHFSGTWYYKANASPHTSCSSAQTGNTVTLTGLSASTSYTYKAYSDSTCMTEITSATTDAEFRTSANTSTTLSADMITATGARLQIANRTSSWYYKADKAPHNTCSSSQTGSFVTLTGLSASTSYTYKAYSDSTCMTEITSATTDAEFNTTAVVTVTLTASARTQTGATLTLANHSAVWWYKRTGPTGGTCTSRTAAQTTAALTGLTKGTNYTYKAYSKTGCGAADVIATAMFSTTDTRTPTNVRVTTHFDAAEPDGYKHYMILHWDFIPGPKRQTRYAFRYKTGAGDWSLWYAAHNGLFNNCDWPCHYVWHASNPSTAYTFQLRASRWRPGLVNKIWDGPPSNGVTATNLNASGMGAQETAAVSLSAAPDPVEEGTPVTVTATLSRALPASVTIPLAVTDVTSEATDYGNLPSIVIAAGDTAGTSAMTTAIDLDGDDETFRVGLDTARLPASLTAGDPATDTVTVTDTTTVTAAPLPAQFPKPPATVQADPGNGEVVLTWSEVSGLGIGWEVQQVQEGSEVWTSTGSASRTHTVTGLTNGNSYTFKVRATSFNGAIKGDASAGVTETAGAPAKPDAVATVNVAHKGTSLAVSWEAPARATHYDAAHSTDGGQTWTDAASAQRGTDLTVTGADRTKAYTVRVRARNAGGESAWTSSASVSFAAPAAPSTVSAVHNGSSLAVTWGASAGAESYGVDLSGDGGGSWSTATPKQTGTGLTIGGVYAGTTYTVRVRARNAAGESGWTSSAPAQAPAPDPVARVNVTHGGSKLVVSWEAPARATHYDVTYSGGGVTGRAAWNRAGESLEITCDIRPEFADRHCIESGATYTVSVRARNAAGESGWATSARATLAAPDAVDTVNVTHNGTSLTVSWEAPAAATHYDVTYSGGGVTGRAAWNRAGESLEIACDVRPEHEGQNCIDGGTAYTVGVRARNAAGESGWTNSASAEASAEDVPGTVGPPAPTEAPDAVAGVTVVHLGNKLAVSWEAPARATHYDVTYSGGGVTGRAAWNRAGESLEITCDSRPAHEGQNCIARGTTYTVGVRARNAAGESGWTNSAAAAPPAALLGVADATAAEPSGTATATLDFVVTLDPAASGTVTAVYTTADGTAVAGSDYTATLGALTFAAGETQKTVEVTVLADAHDDGGETMKLLLLSASGATISDAEATGTITNEGPLQRAWLARFGRAAAADAVAAVTARLETPRDAGSHLTVGGQRLDLAGTEGSAALEQALAGFARLLGAPGAPGPEAEPGGWPDPGAAFHGAGAVASPAATMRTRELLTGTSFRAVLGTGAGAQWTGWGQGASVSAFSSADPDLSLSGETATGSMGVDWERGRLIAGFAMTHSLGEGTAEGSGRSYAMGSAVTTLLPYARFALTERLSAWGLAGTGTGRLTLDLDGNTPERYGTDLAMAFAAVGVRGDLLTPAEAGGFALALKADAFRVRTESAAVAAPGVGHLAGARAEASRVRAVLDGSRTFALASGRSLTPSVALGLRHDGGDAETGTGVEVGAGVGYADPVRGLDVALRVYGLAAHADDGYGDWGVSGSLHLAPGAAGRGLTASLVPSYGTDPGGTERLWALPDASGLAVDDAAPRSGRLDGELGYGLPVSGGLTGTPYAGFGVSDAAREVRMGWRLAPAGGGGFTFSLDAVRREGAGAVDAGAEPAAEHRVGFGVTASW